MGVSTEGIGVILRVVTALNFGLVVVLVDFEDRTLASVVLVAVEDSTGSGNGSNVLRREGKGVKVE